jgi:hypothetical protein
MVYWNYGCLYPDVFIALSSATYVLNCSWGSCNDFLLLVSSSVGVGVLTLYELFICLSVLGWYIRGDDQDLAI